MNTEFWKKSTGTIFIGVVLYYVCDILVGFFTLISYTTRILGGAFDDFGSLETFGSFGFGDIGKIIMEGAVFVGAMLLFYGLRQFTDAVDRADKENVKRLYNGVILLAIGGIVGFILGLIPLVGGVIAWFISAPLDIIGTVLMLVSFNRLKKSATFPVLAQKGASRLFVAMILSIITIAFGWFPFIGMPLAIITTVFACIGWKNIKDAAGTGIYPNQNYRSNYY